MSLRIKEIVAYFLSQMKYGENPQMAAILVSFCVNSATKKGMLSHWFHKSSGKVFILVSSKKGDVKHNGFFRTKRP